MMMTQCCTCIASGWWKYAEKCRFYGEVLKFEIDMKYYRVYWNINNMFYFYIQRYMKNWWLWSCTAGTSKSSWSYMYNVQFSHTTNDHCEDGRKWPSFFSLCQYFYSLTHMQYYKKYSCMHEHVSLCICVYFKNENNQNEYFDHAFLWILSWLSWLFTLKIFNNFEEFLFAIYSLTTTVHSSSF